MNLLRNLKRNLSIMKINLPEFVNYIGVFLTFDCNLKCGYCINNFSGALNKPRTISGAQWIDALNRLILKPDLPVTLQGGEPTLHPDFHFIINNLRKDINIDILTNLCFDLKKFVKLIDPQRLNRNAPYAPIRVSYHPQSMKNQDALINKILFLQDAGFKVGLFGIDLPDFQEYNNEMRRKCGENNIDFRLKEFLGFYNDTLFGHYKYADAITGRKNIRVKCKPSELLINPAGDVFKCHYHLYSNIHSTGNMTNIDFTADFDEIECLDYGLCNPCDVKIKNNRHQVFGHTSVTITNN